MFFGIILGFASIGLMVVNKLIARNQGGFFEINMSLENFKKTWHNEDQYCGFEFAEKMKEEYRLDKVNFEVDGLERNYYTPKRNIVRLSKDVGYSKSITALVITMHEMMHAVQHNGKGNLFTILTGLRILIKRLKKISVAIIVVAFTATIFLDTNILYLLAIMFPLTLVFMEDAIELYIEHDAWKRLKKSEAIKEIVHTEEEKNEVKKVISTSFNAYLFGCIKSFLVVVIVGMFFYIIKTYAPTI